MNLATQLDLFEGGWCQRCTDRVHTWRHSDEDGAFDKGRYLVRPIAHRDAAAFVLRHHYYASYPAARLRYGLVERDTDQLVGVIVIGIPTNSKVITNPLPTLDLATGADLSRLVLLDEVPANAESWFIGQVLPAAYEQGLRALVAFADGVPRPDVDMPGHVGIIYQASNADYCGRATAGDLKVLPDGTVLTRRTLQKARAGERGAGGVVRRLVANGARPPANPAGDRLWLRQALRDVGARKVPHPGVHRFVIRLGSARQRRMVPLGEGFEPGPYPKRPDPAPVYRPAVAA